MLTDLRLRHFRSYSDETFEFSQGVNIVVGPNASGKTNLLEAVLLLCRGSSYRAKDAELVAFKAPWSRLEAHAADETRVAKLNIENAVRGLEKTFEIDSQTFKRLSLQKSLPVVLFEPNHLLLLTGGPDRRREFIDSLLEQTITGYASLLRQYRRTLAQRNTLLKKGRASATSQLFAWNIRLSELGSQIAIYRMQLVEHINASLSQLYSHLARHESAVTVRYVTTCHQQNYASDMLHKIEQNIERDFMLGYTSVGPHRDDIAIELNRHPLQLTASRGEARTMLLALKIMELQKIEELRGQPPILLLDDVFSELDGVRRQALTEYLSNHQTFITTTDADVVVNHFTETANIIPLSAR